MSRDKGARALLFNSESGLVRGASAGLVVATALAMLKLTWFTWPDPIVDFGRELYVPWRLTEGQALYSDIAYHNGPLSPHLNALWFSVVGVSLRSLVWLNLAIVAGVTWLLYRFLRDLAGVLAAALGGCAFVVLFAFGQFTGIGNYNWLCPYSHEMTHGIALSLLSVHFLRSHVRTGALWRAAACGLALGGAFLTKAEVALAGAAAIGCGMALVLPSRSEHDPRRFATLCALVSGALLPAAVSVSLLATSMPLLDALRSTIGTWAYVFDQNTIGERFFLGVSGLDDVGGNTWRMLVAAACWIALFVPAGVAAFVVRKARERHRAVTLSVGLAYAVGYWALWRSIPWNDWLLPLPLFVGALLVVELIHGVRHRHEREHSDLRAARLALLVFALTMLVKMLLNVRVGHYGFGLAMAGTLVLIAAMTSHVPRMITRYGGHGPTFAVAVAVSWVVMLLVHVAMIDWSVDQKRFAVGSGDDAFLADERGAILQQAIRWIDAHAAPDATMTTFVDCEMLNYLTRRRNPLRYGNFNPQQVLLFGEENMKAALEASPPDYIALVHKDTAEFGPRFFGPDYGGELASWIRRSYEPEEVLSAHPFYDHRFGIKLLRRLP
jgi:hypothetical protein